MWGYLVWRVPTNADDVGVEMQVVVDIWKGFVFSILELVQDGSSPFNSLD
jgi:hypothetical protein